MPQGLQVWNAAGQLVLDVSERTGKVLGTTTIVAGVDGSVTDADFALGSFFFVATPKTTYPTFRPTFTFAGTTLSWAWEGRSGVDCALVWGVW